MVEQGPDLPRGLYLVTPECNDVRALRARVAPVLAHAVMVQLRCKSADAGVRRAQADWLREATRHAGVRFVVNDDIELALACNADGVHLGREDGALADARARLGGRAIVGASCYDDFARARAAVAEGASYVAFGAVFPSSTKPEAVQAPLDLFAQARAAGMTSVAIGGITPETIGRVVDAGADMAAVIAGVFEAPDPISAARQCAAAFHTRDCAQP